MAMASSRVEAMNDPEHPMPDQSPAIDQVMRQLHEDGRFIEAGWQALEMLAGSAATGRRAFFEGARYLFALLGGGEVPVDVLRGELEGFEAELRQWLSGSPRPGDG